MNVAVLSTLIETSIPHGVTFNSCGVAQRGLIYSFKFQKLEVIFRVCTLNGMWGGGIDIRANLCGVGVPVSRLSFKFASFEECTTYLWCRSADFIERNKSGVSMEFLHFKVAMKKWFTLSSEEKFKLFKEGDFYGW